MLFFKIPYLPKRYPLPTPLPSPLSEVPKKRDSDENVNAHKIDSRSVSPHTLKGVVLRNQEVQRDSATRNSFRNIFYSYLFRTSSFQRETTNDLMGSWTSLKGQNRMFGVDHPSVLLTKSGLLRRDVWPSLVTCISWSWDSTWNQRLMVSSVGHRRTTLRHDFVAMQEPIHDGSVSVSRKMQWGNSEPELH